MKSSTGLLDLFLLLSLLCAAAMGALVVRMPGIMFRGTRMISPPAENSQQALECWLRQEGLLFTFDLVDFSDASLEIIGRFHPSFFSEYASIHQLRDVGRIYEQRVGVLGPSQLQQYQAIKDLIRVRSTPPRCSVLARSADAILSGTSMSLDDGSIGLQGKALSSSAIDIPKTPLRFSREIHFSLDGNEEADPCNKGDGSSPETGVPDRTDVMFDLWGGEDQETSNSDQQ